MTIGLKGLSNFDRQLVSGHFATGNEFMLIFGRGMNPSDNLPVVLAIGVFKLQLVAAQIVRRCVIFDDLSTSIFYCSLQFIA